MRKRLLSIVPILAVSGPAAAGPLDDGFTAYIKNYYVDALRLWRPFADQGHASTKLQLGFMCDKGEGVPQDYAEAGRSYRRAAEQRNAVAQANLGVMHYRARGVGMRKSTSADAKNHFGDLVDAARGAPVAITKYDRPFVVVMAMEEYERLVRGSGDPASKTTLASQAKGPQKKAGA